MDLKIFEIAANNKNNNLLKNYDYILKQKNSMCGDEIEISVKLKNKKISKIGYTCKSCIYTQASASLLSNSLKNKSFDKVKIKRNPETYKFEHSQIKYKNAKMCEKVCLFYLEGIFKKSERIIKLYEY